MADGRQYSLNQQLGIEQILQEAQHRWLRPAEICEILRNYQKFHIAPEPPHRPSSGSLFLFDRKVLRYFRKDGHNWRKKKDGKTVKEAHERLKADSVDVLHCYYAHGEENESFQRRTYWMLEETFMHIVLVHYLEVKGGKASSYSRTRDDKEITKSSQTDSPICSNSFTSQDQLPSQTTDAGSPSSAQTSEYEDSQSDNYQARSGHHPLLGLQQYENGHLMDVHLLNSNIPISSLINQYNNQSSLVSTPETDLCSGSKESIAKVFNRIGLGLGFNSGRTQLDLPPWDEVLEHHATGISSTPVPTSLQAEAAATSDITKQVNLTFGELLTGGINFKQQDESKAELQEHPRDIDSVASSQANVKCELSLDGIMSSPAILKQSSAGLSNVEGEGLKKYDSFSKWMSKEFTEVDDPHKSTSQAYWNFMENVRVDDSGMSNPEQDAFIVGPSVSQDQLFSIIDYSPNWAYSGIETKVLITGTFLKEKKDVENIKLSCMFAPLSCSTT
ncbi:uncharacterized protein A4U43_C03F2300 [Asparagus officinalis]|uniref:CG-1 domain-containing protein n=1 Tax=Asparagus officinalis TaxID=4686 RepID=A0A5P1F8H9_ASPOF|nr:uncharacterized protein A4U43_C03F2300 [Asparagus officinalis]